MTCDLILKATVVLHNFIQGQESKLPPNQRKYFGRIKGGNWRNDDAGNGLTKIQLTRTNNSKKLQEIGMFLQIILSPKKDQFHDKRTWYTVVQYQKTRFNL